MAHGVFAYGTLQVPDIAGQIVGRPVTGSAAVLEGYARFELMDRVYPAIVRQMGGSVTGVFYGRLEEREIAQLDAYEGSLYERHEAWITSGDTRLRAFTYVLREEHRDVLCDTPWDLDAFCRCHLAEYLALIRGTARAPMV